MIVAGNGPPATRLSKGRLLFRDDALAAWLAERGMCLVGGDWGAARAAEEASGGYFWRADETLLQPRQASDGLRLTRN